MQSGLKKGKPYLNYLLSGDEIFNEQSNDLEMVQRAAAGDQNVFRRLFENNVSRVYSLCLRMSAGDVLLSEELTQDVFVKAWENLGSFRGDSKFPTWLHRIAVNEFLMRKRSQKRFMQRITITDDLTAFEHTKAGGAQQFGSYSSSLSAGIDLEKAISSLPEQARVVFILHDVHGYKHNEIAEMVDIETGTSKAHLHRARKLLREELSK
jgi:RNA polymerase sigma factor (sigma-70 family)